MLKTYNAAVAAAAGNGVVNEVFIPYADLIGSFPLNDADSKVNYARALHSFSEKLTQALGDTSIQKLGQSIQPSQGTGTGLLHNFTYSFNSSVYASMNPADNLTSAVVLPVPTSGTQIGVGDYAFTDLFPNAAKVPAEGAITAKGISFVASDLTQYGVPAFGTINLASDSRQLVMAIMFDLAFNQLVRATGITSAITASNLGASQNTTITAAQTQTNNGTIGLNASQLDNIFASSRTASWTIQTQLNTSTNVYDVLVA